VIGGVVVGGAVAGVTDSGAVGTGISVVVHAQIFPEDRTQANKFMTTDVFCTGFSCPHISGFPHAD
jgi:hypothetical protein